MKFLSLSLKAFLVIVYTCSKKFHIFQKGAIEEINSTADTTKTLSQKKTEAKCCHKPEGTEDFA